MARGDIRTKSEYQYQSELREERRRHRKPHSREERQVVRDEPADKTLKMILVSADVENRKEAYRRLDCDAVVSVARRYKYHDPKQLTVMRGRVVFENLTQTQFSQIVSELSRGGYGWRQDTL